VLDGLLLLQDKIARGDRTPAVVKPRRDPAVLGGNLVTLGKKSTADHE
jgi:NADH-quinone oxidoreductase subunit B